MTKLIIATKNPGKVKEMVELLSGLPYEVRTLLDYPDAPDVEETGCTFVENAVIKATAYASFTGELTLADDSGLEVDALDGAPGVFSSRFAPTESERNERLLSMIKDVPDDRRTARFRCVIAIADPSGDVRTCEGSVEGVIAHEPKGHNGFGYDPIFFIPNLKRHFAELDSSHKNAISHRGKALVEARKMLAARNDGN